MIIETVKKTRSYRSFNANVKIPYSELIQLVDCARLSASSMNLQPLKYKLSYNNEECDKLIKLMGWAKALPAISLPPKGHEPTAYITICFDKNIHANPASFMTDVGIAAQSIMLCATEKEFGGCMIGNFFEKSISQALRLSENLIPVLVIALGKTDETVKIVDYSEAVGTKYFRKNGVHYVPKRALSDVLIP